jgi:membrane-associated phospholipid phosphatase
MDASAGSRRLPTYLLWSFRIGAVFVSIYPTLNWVTSLRANPFHLYLPIELRIPLLPWFIWPYLSMYVLFALPAFLVPTENLPSLGKQLIAGSIISAVMFLLLPAQLGFARALPSQEPYRAIFAWMFHIDRPYNLVPSLHVIFSTAIALACAGFARPVARIAILLWLVLVVSSTVFVHQHHLIDVIAALVIVVLLRRRFEVRHA